MIAAGADGGCRALAGCGYVKLTTMHTNMLSDKRVQQTTKMHDRAVVSVSRAAQLVLAACQRIRNELFVHSDDEGILRMCSDVDMSYDQTFECALGLAYKYTDTLGHFIAEADQEGQGERIAMLDMLDMLRHSVNVMKDAYDVAVQTEAIASVELDDYNKIADQSLIESAASSTEAVPQSPTSVAAL